MKSQPDNQVPTKKKILYVITRGTWGGAQKYVADLATGLASDFDISVALGSEDGKKDLQQKLEQSAVNIIELKHLVRRISPLHDFLTVFELGRLYKKIKPDIVHLNSSKAGILGSIANIGAKNPKPKIVYTAHGWVFNEPLSWIRKKIYIFLEKRTARKKDRIIVLSKYDRTAGQRLLGIAQKQFAAIPLGLEPTAYLEKQAARQYIEEKSGRTIPMNQPWIGVVANLYKTKGIDILLEAIAGEKTLQQIPVVLIGDGPEKNTIISQIKQLRLEQIYLLGFVENAAAYLRAFDLFVLPSRKEGFPYTMLEVTGAGVPVIATDVGGVSEIIQNKKTGILIPPMKPAMLAEAIRHGLREKAVMERCAQKAKEATAAYTKERMIKKTTELYRSLLLSRESNR